jgi:hypothetical protein
MNVKELLDALDEIKRIRKRVPAEDWTPEFREIANIAHRTLRDQAHVEALQCALRGGAFTGNDVSVVCDRCANSSNL